MQTQSQNSIFIHSLFRAGSTYIFNVFRRSNAGYWCYQEPLHEYLFFAKNNPQALMDVHIDVAKHLRHPSMDKPYFYEFYPIAEKILPLFKREFAYDQYFTQDIDELTDLMAYVEALTDNAQGRPVFQCCRSAGRVSAVKPLIDGTNIFLWRNPWDQWYSYKIDRCFDASNLLIANARTPPTYIRAIKKELGFAEYHNAASLEEEIMHFQKRSLDAKGSYALFYALWCHAMLAAYPSCDMAINIDTLSNSMAYRKSILETLSQMGIAGINFDDCQVPQGHYGKSDVEFFAEVENAVHTILRQNGVSATQLETVQQLREQHKPHPDADLAGLMKELEQARALARRNEDHLSARDKENEQLSHAQKSVGEELSGLVNSWSWRLSKPLRFKQYIEHYIKTKKRN